MRLCSVTSLMKFYPLPEALAVIAEAGYQGVELWGGLPHAYTDDFYEGGKLDQATVDRCRKLLDASGLEPVSFLPEQCFYPVNFLIDEAPPFDGAKLRERSLAYFERAIDLTAALGIARMLVTTPFWGWARHGERFRYGAGKALPRVVESFGRLTRRAEQRGVTLVLEPLTFLETTAVETLDDLAGGARRRRLEARWSPCSILDTSTSPPGRWGSTRSSICRPTSTASGRACSICTSTTITAISTRTCCPAKAISTSSPPTMR